MVRSHRMRRIGAENVINLPSDRHFGITTRQKGRHRHYSTAIAASMLFRLFVLLVTSVALCSFSNPRIDWDPISARTSDGCAQLHGIDAVQKIPGEYGVIFCDGHTLEAHNQCIRRKASDFPRIRRVSFGYRANLDEELVKVEHIAFLH